MKKHIIRRAVGGLLAAALCLLTISGCTRKKAATPKAGLKQIVIAEPAKLLGYLPLYIAEREGYFKEQGLKVKVIDAAGGNHVTAVVSGSAWGLIGGVDSMQLGSVGSSDPLVGFVNCVNRANVYLFAAKGLAPKSTSTSDLRAFLKGKKIISGRYGGTPDLLTRLLLIDLGLDPSKDVTLIENSDATTVIAMMKNGTGQIGNGAEPQIIEGISQGVSGEPFYKFPDMGDFSYSVLGTKKSTLQNDPETVQKVTNAMIKALKTVQDNKTLVKKDAKLEFPSLSDQDIQASLNRAYTDKLWSSDGYISQKAVENCKNMLTKTGIFKGTCTYETAVDMSFVKKSKQ